MKKELYFKDYKASAYKNKKSRLEQHKYYFYVNSTGEIIKIQDNDLLNDSRRHFKGNYFNTEEEARNSKFYKIFNK